MRIIAGEFRSRRLKTLPGLSLRPSSDRLRETLFNVLADRVRGGVFVDCFAGSGAVGLEAISRGATQAVFLEQAKGALAVIHQNIDSLGVDPRTLVIEGPVRKTLPRVAAGAAVIFLDPPYSDAEAYASTLQVLAARLADSSTLIVAEHASRDELLPPPELRRTRLLRQGDSALSFFEKC